MFEGQSDTVEFPMQDAHMPDEVVDVSDSLLVRFGSKENIKQSQRPMAFARPTVGQENVLLFENNFGFVWTFWQQTD